MSFLLKLFLNSVLLALIQLYDRCMRLQYRWFAKRFLHPDIVSEYEYIFLWDEDIGVENFDATR